MRLKRRINAVISASRPHSFLASIDGVTASSARAATLTDTGAARRGGRPNYDSVSIAMAKLRWLRPVSPATWWWTAPLNS